MGIICLCGVGVQASTTELTYKGTGILSWRSVNDFKLTSTQTVTVDHTQTLDTASEETSLTVSVCKHNFVGASVEFSESFTGETSGSFSGDLDKGKYFLRFESSEKAKKFDIEGSVSY